MTNSAELPAEKGCWPFLNAQASLNSCAHAHRAVSYMWPTFFEASRLCIFQKSCPLCPLHHNSSILSPTENENHELHTCEFHLLAIFTPDQILSRAVPGAAHCHELEVKLMTMICVFTQAAPGARICRKVFTSPVLRACTFTRPKHVHRHRQAGQRQLARSFGSNL